MEAEPAGDEGTSPPLARPSQRLGGALIDGATLQLVALVLGGAGRPVAAALGATLYLSYVVALTVLRGQTLGKVAMGAKVVDERTGQLPGLWQAATRAVVPLAGVVVDVALGAAVVGMFWALAVYGWLLFDERRRGVHDRAAGTVVTEVERSELHRRAGVAAVAAALGVTALLVAAAVGELEDEQLTAPPVAASVPTR